MRVEDSPASHDDAGFAFLSNEIYVGFAARAESYTAKWLGVIPVTRTRHVPALDLRALAARLAAVEGVGEPDFQDEGMLQYLKAERVKAPWQTKGIKVVEMVRIYQAIGRSARSARSGLKADSLRLILQADFRA